MKKSKPAKNVELIGYKFYGIPSDHDRQLELKTFGCCRKVWNLMLADKNQYYQANQKLTAWHWQMSSSTWTRPSADSLTSLESFRSLSQRNMPGTLIPRMLCIIPMRTEL